MGKIFKFSAKKHTFWASPNPVRDGGTVFSEIFPVPRSQIPSWDGKPSHLVTLHINSMILGSVSCRRKCKQRLFFRPESLSLKMAFFDLMDASLRLKSPPPGSGTPPGRGVPESLLSPVLVKATPPVTFTGASATAIPPDAEGSNCSRPTTTGFKSFPGHPKTLQGSREAGDQMRARFQVDRFRSILNLKPIRPWCRVDPLWLRRLRQPKGQCALHLMMRGTTSFTLKPAALVLKADDVNPAQVSPPAGGEPGETATPPASGASSAWGGLA